MYLVHPLPTTYVHIHTHFLFGGIHNVPQDYPKTEPCMLVSVKARTGYDLEFQVLTHRGVLRDKLPIEALIADSNSPSVYKQAQLQRWCCQSNYLTVVQLPLQTGKVWIEGKQVKFKYMFTVDFAPSTFEPDPGSDAHIPCEHKAMHIIQVGGQFAAMPNNSLVWDHPSLVPADLQLSSNPGYLVQSEDYSVERWKCAKPAVIKDLQLYDSP